MRIVTGILAVILLVVVGCTTAERNSDDVAQTQPSVTSSSKVSALEVNARNSNTTTVDMGRAIQNAEERTVRFDLLTAPVLRRGLSEDAAIDAICDALGEVMHSGPSLTRDHLSRIIFTNLVISLRGNRISALLATQDLVNELSDGTANEPLWARVALSKSGHCRQKQS